MIKRVLIVALACLCGHLSAGDLSAATTAKFVRLLLQGAGVHAVACGEREVAGELTNLGVALDPESKVVWADSDKDVARFAKQGRMVICGSKVLLGSGATLAVVAEGGHPVIYLNPRALTASGVTLPDNIVKLAKVSQ